MTVGAGAEEDRRQSSARQPGAALAWSFANIAVARFGTILIGIALARLLGPEEFGTYAVAFVALMAILSFNELGVSLAIVRWNDDPATIAPTVTTISVGASALLTVLAMAVAPAFARAMGDPGAGEVVQLLSVCVLINGVVATPAALLQRYFRQDQRMVADQVNVWVGAFVSLALAVAGMGAMSLVIGRVSGAMLSGALFIRYSPLPYRFGWDRRYVRPLLKFGLPLAGASIIVFLVGFVDQLVVGHVLGAALLGYYVLANNLASWPVTMFSQPMRSVAPAMFSRIQDDPVRMQSDFRKLLRPLAAAALPVCVAIAAAAPEIIRFVYGEEWLPAADILRWLAMLAAFRIFFELAYDYLVVVQRSAAILVIQATWLVVLVPAIIVAVHEWGTVGVAATLVLVSALVSVPMYLTELRRAGVRPTAVAGALVPPLSVSLALVGFTVLVTSSAAGRFLALLLTGTATLGAIAALLYFARRDLTVFRVNAA